MIPGDSTFPPGTLSADIDWSGFNPVEDDERDRWERRLERAERYFDDNQRDD